MASKIITNITREKMAMAKRGIKRSEESKCKQSRSMLGANHHAAKTWILLSPDDKLIRTNAMSQFCKERNINYFSLRNKAQMKDQRAITRGTAKGWCVLSCKNKVQEFLVD
jgi:hypothetical protein